MIVFLTVIYVALLFLLIKMNRVPNSKGTWLTIIPYELFLIIGFFIPMQWGAPAGFATTLAYSVSITPNVNGVVTEVPVESDKPVKQGDVLFKIDPTQYQAALDGLKAQLVLAETRLKQSQALAKEQAGSIYELQAYQAQADGLKAQIVSAEWNLAETIVRAPSDGIVTYVGLRPGARVANLPFFRAMAFIDTSEPLLGAQIPQNFSQHIEPGQDAEVTFEAHPGKIYSARVMYVLPATAQGQVQVTGFAAQPLATQAGPFFVRLKLNDPQVEASLLPGSSGSVAIYTSRVKVAHVIRKVMVRMEAIMNYIDPR
ncbi:MAG: HlyD family secretion protein [Gammaproteobacteria bacterium]